MFDKMKYIYMLTYMCFLVGIWLMFYEPIVFLYRKILIKNRLRQKGTSGKLYGKFSKEVEVMLITLGIRRISSDLFVTLQLFIAIVLFVSFTYISGALMAAVLAVASFVLPYFALVMRIENMKKKGSHEGEKLISEFLAQYRIANFNIYRTMELVISNRKDIKISGNLLYQVLLEMRSSGNVEKIKEATKIFANGINTNWSRMFANNLAIAGESGINIQAALEDLLIQLREARQLFEERKRLNSEARRMLLGLIPLLYFGIFFASIKYLDVPLNKILKNQFTTPEGIGTFMICVLLYLFNIVLIEAVRGKSFDF